MLELTVENRNGILVVDSRLIAEELGIEHKNLLSTIDGRILEIESEFGAVTFETTPRKDNNKGGSQPRKEYLFIGNNISYLDQALKTVLGLD